MQLFRSHYFGFLMVLAVSCATPEPPPPIDLPPQVDVEESLPRRTAAVHLSDLERVAPAESVKGGLATDLKAFLRAENSIEKKERSYAEHYAEVIKSSPSRRIQDLAFQRWVSTTLSLQEKPPSRRQFGSIFLAELKSFGVDDFLKAQGIKDNNALEQKLLKDFSKLTFAYDPSQLEVNFASEQPLKQGQIDAPKTLENLFRVSLKVCGIKTSDDEIGFGRPLSPLRARLFSAHVLSCRNKPVEAIAAYEQIVGLNTKHPEFPFVKYYALRQLTKLYKAQSQRAEVAKAYARLVTLAVDERALAFELEVDIDTLKLAMIDNLLWAGRNKALSGAYEEAEVYCKQAITKIDEMARSSSQNGRNAEALRIFKAEAYQSLATRIALEKKDLDGAIAYLVLGLNINSLNKEWQARFNWLLGLYQFANEAYVDAARYWETLLKSTVEESDQARIHFWLARAYDKSGDKAKSQAHLEDLLSESPLSYYTVVGTDVASLGEKADWKADFTNLHGKYLNLVDQVRFDLTDLRYQEDISSLLLRAEIGIAADLPKEVVQPLVRDVMQQLPKYRKKLGAKVYARAQVYMSRLLFAAGLYGQSFALTQSLASADKDFWKEWPDQIYVLFPQPYQDVVKWRAQQVNLEEDLIYAIARQESSFNAVVESPAGAIGLMQLIPPTARRFAKKLQTDYEPISEKLKEPAVNIHLGAAYLNFLSNYYKNNDAAVYGAYNAGEFAVDSWIERRKYSDPLMWVEMIPFGETCGYVKNVWRNREIYKFMSEMKARWAFDFEQGVGAVIR